MPRIWYLPGVISVSRKGCSVKLNSLVTLLFWNNWNIHCLFSVLIIVRFPYFISSTTNESVVVLSTSANVLSFIMLSIAIIGSKDNNEMKLSLLALTVVFKKAIFSYSL